MSTHNQTMFILVGFTLGSRSQTCVFLLLLLIYLISLAGNITITAAIWMDKRLHTAMYTFLSSLSTLDVLFITCTVPKFLTVLAKNNRTIAFSECIIQLYFYMSLGSIELFILALMAIDRHVAISHPLRYNLIITSKTSWWLVSTSWAAGFIYFIYPITLIIPLSFCGNFEINHFFCEGSALVKISCSDTKLFDAVFSSFSTIVIMVTISIIAISYIHILVIIMKIPTSMGKRKTFSTCTSHFMAVSLAYGSIIFLYVRSLESASALNKVVGILNSILTPFSNPFIYSLQNKQVHEVLRDAAKHISSRIREYRYT